MRQRITMDTRDELLESLVKRYQAADRGKKGRILDEFVELTGHHRKHATRVLNSWTPKSESPDAKRGRRVYDGAVREALVVFWEASGRVCGKRLRAAIPELLVSMEHHGHIVLDTDVRVQVLSMSAATIDRALEHARAEQGKPRRRQRGAPESVKASVPVRTFIDQMRRDVSPRAGPCAGPCTTGRTLASCTSTPRPTTRRSGKQSERGHARGCRSGGTPRTPRR